jgi:DNA (cytosine-5)-methyltransferase 1
VATYNIAGLFSGIGGFELGFERALGERVQTEMLCEWWGPAQAVLARRFPDIPVHPDVRELTDLPAAVNLVTAGFPCTDLSQAGRTAGIAGKASGLVMHVFEALRAAKRRRSIPTLVIENVPNMLALDRGHAMRFLVDEIERLGYRWAYRVVDSRFVGVPQRRRRVILVASVDIDPRAVLFADDAGERPSWNYSDEAFGFYWTEGRSGLGWAQDAVPTLKAGSTVGIPSPPAVWLPKGVVGRKFLKPTIEDAEAMQGFERGWTDVDNLSSRRLGDRWKMVGNAVTVGVSQWVAARLAGPGTAVCGYKQWEPGPSAWPTNSWGERGKVWFAPELSEFPAHAPYGHLIDALDLEAAETVSCRAGVGFWSRLQRGNLGRYPGFRSDLVEHIEHLTEPSLSA